MRVRAPGSSANLGPGFDVLGLAISRYVWLADSGVGEPCGPDHIARIAYEAAGGTGPVWFEFEVEPSRGLGFSGAARAAGAVLAGLQDGLDIEQAQRRAYPVVAEIEGHGDNAAPSVFGGIHVVAGDHAHRLDAPFPGRLLFWVPDHETPTDKSRGDLAPKVSRSDAVFNVGRASLLMAAIYEQRPDLLRQATQDRLHQPDRFRANEPTAVAYDAALEAGALAAWLSGSGPTVAAVVDDGCHDAVRAALGHNGNVLDLAVDNDGTVVDNL